MRTAISLIITLAAALTVANAVVSHNHATVFRDRDLEGLDPRRCSGLCGPLCNHSDEHNG